jgi:trigger factor
MKAELKKIDKTKIEIFFEFLADEFNVFYNKALEHLNQHITMDGFRPGKAPKEIVEQKAGQGRILEEAAGLALQKHYPQFLADNNLEVLGQPQVEILKVAKGNALECRVKAEILPVFNLPDYQKIAADIKGAEIKVEDKELEEALEWIRKSKATFEDLNRPAAKEDMVDISYQSEQIENNQELEDRFFLGKGQLVPGFEEHIEGMQKGESKEFEVVFPKEYFNPALADKPVKFKLTLRNAQKAIFPDLNDELAKSLGKFENLEALKQNVKDGLAHEKQHEVKQQRREAIISALLEKTNIDLPEILLQQEKARLLEQQQHDITEQLGITLEDYIAKNYKTEQAFQESLQKQAEYRLKSFLILQAIGKQEKIQVLDSEVEQACQQFLNRYGSKEAVPKDIDPEKLKGYNKGVIFTEKVFQKLESF